MDKRTIVIAAFAIFVIFSAVMYYSVFPPAYENGGEEDNQSETEWILTLKVNGDSVGVYNVSQLSEMTNPMNITSHGEVLTIQATSILRLLEEHDIYPDSVIALKPLALDGYSIEINGTYVPDVYIRIVEQENIATNGALRLVVTELSSSKWVKYLVEIDLEV
jgi:hypothetical protein